MSNKAYAAVTPSDTVPLTTAAKSLYVGVTGDVTVLGVVAVSGVVDTTPTVFKAVPAGWFVLPFPVAQIMATGTTATNLVATAS
jgi:hypothetical protein